MNRPAHTGATEKFVAYYRVSTHKQGRSGLGLEAQREIVLQFIKHNGNRIIAEFTEVESGRKDRQRRPELEKAIQTCKEQDACLVVAKLDRLSRSLSLVLTLQEEEVPFVCCDLPQANEFTIHIIAAVAQWEAKMIRERINAAHKAKHEREPNWKHGNPEWVGGYSSPEVRAMSDAARAKAWASTKRNADESKENRVAYEFIARRREAGMAWEEIARELNREGYTTRYGKKFYGQTVINIYKRFANPTGS